MSWKDDLNAFLVKAIMYLWQRFVRASENVQHNAHRAKGLWHRAWSISIGGRDPYIAGHVSGVLVGFLGLLLSIVLPWEWLRIPEQFELPAILVMIAGIAFFGVIQARKIWGFGDRDSANYMQSHLVTLFPFTILRGTAGENALWLPTTILVVWIAVESILAVRWTWNAFPEGLREFLREIAQDWRLRRQVRHWVRFTADLIGISIVVLLFFYNSDRPSEAEFTARSTKAAMWVGLTWMVVWTVRWSLEIVRRWKRLRDWSNEMSEKWGEAIYIPNLSTMIAIFVPGVLGFWSSVFGGMTIPLLANKGAGWIYTTLIPYVGIAHEFAARLIGTLS